MVWHFPPAHNSLDSCLQMHTHICTYVSLYLWLSVWKQLTKCSHIAYIRSYVAKISWQFARVDFVVVSYLLFSLVLFLLLTLQSLLVCFLAKLDHWFWFRIVCKHKPIYICINCTYICIDMYVYMNVHTCILMKYINCMVILENCKQSDADGIEALHLLKLFVHLLRYTHTMYVCMHTSIVSRSNTS